MKTNETSNQMGKCEKCGATQFLSYGICNYNGICNGKIIPIKISTREQALAWWNNLSLQTQQEITKRTRLAIDSPLIGIGLTSREIEEIWLKETQDVPEIPIHLKLNQKQFKQANPELINAYFNKFSKEDLYKIHLPILISLLDSLDYKEFIMNQQITG